MLEFHRPGGDALVVRIAGDWILKNPLPSSRDVGGEISSGPGIRKVAFDTQALGSWDSGLLTFLLQLFDRCAAAGVAVGKRTPRGPSAPGPRHRGPRAGRGREAQRIPFLARIGDAASGPGSPTAKC
jgi:hypothetical protein